MGRVVFWECMWAGRHGCLRRHFMDALFAQTWMYWRNRRIMLPLSITGKVTSISSSITLEPYLEVVVEVIAIALLVDRSVVTMRFACARIVDAAVIEKVCFESIAF